MAAAVTSTSSLRHNGNAYQQKLRAFENLRKYSRRKHTIFACAALGVNDQYLADLIQFCYENRGVVSDLGILPLYENWKPGEYEVTKHTTQEDVEKMLQQSVPGGGVDFIPGGMTHWLAVMRPFFSNKPGMGLLNFAGIHPNCESVTFLIPDGTGYRGLNHYLNKPLAQAAGELAEIVKRIEPKLARLDPAKPWQRLRGKLICLGAVLPWLLRTINKRRLLGSHPIINMVRTAWSALAAPPHQTPHRTSLAGQIPPRRDHPAGGAAFDRFGTTEVVPGRLGLRGRGDRPNRGHPALCLVPLPQCHHQEDCRQVRRHPQREESGLVTAQRLGGRT